ncbi:50S ribosomal protein L22 [Candidatus Peregrinibacteria bacterium]|jgi:large subunit ribosomal protein L22|nr:50S ribosomal protein L22 [Candidatus Peregrinibacteria bacterium]MBT7484427.1 50S ribosomal protein L22 [Candidatus Peregrinibacteria bacterium]MBT7703692.1 50S ribosomal protein L22 [Candidatus Peregrinibacteria bacterium]
MIAHLRRTRISPKKLSLVAAMIRKKSVNEALEILKFTPKKAAATLYKVVQSAGKNAENNFKQDPTSLVIKEIIVTQGPTYKRWQSVSRGRAHPILKRTSHVTVKIESSGKVEEPKKKVAAKKEEPKTETPKKPTEPTESKKS